MKRCLSLLFTWTLACLAYAASPLPATSNQAMVVTSQHLATQVGLDVLQHGGNAIDAAVAVGYALAVVHPCCGNLGGGGFMLIHFANGKNTFINFREKAPAAISPNLFLDNTGNLDSQKATQSYLAVGIPGTVKGLNYALQKYGTLPLATLIQPAIDYAQNGYELTTGDIHILQDSTKLFEKNPNAAAIFLNHGKPYQAGQKLIQKDLATSLTVIKQQGDNGFYQGAIADKIVAASHANGGVLTKKDFENYTVEELKPITCQYRDNTILSAPPPSSGGITLCEMLNVLSAYPLNYFDYHSADSVHYMVEAMRYAYKDRNQYLGDPDFITIPTDQLLSQQHAQKIRQHIQRYQASSSLTQDSSSDHERPETTHYSIVDKDGNAVAVTYTINGLFGTGLIAGNTGILLNNENDDFTLKLGSQNMFQLQQGENNLIAPNKRPLSSMTPTIVLKHGKLSMVLGAPGGSTIITQVLQVLLNVIDYGMNIQQAADAPRFHMQAWPDTIFMEPYTLSQDTQQKLAQMGYSFTRGSPYGVDYWGAIAAIMIDPQTGKLQGAIDSRRPAGLAKGSNAS